MSVDSVVDAVGGDPGYIRFLIAERHAIRSALEARSAPLDPDTRTLAYPSSIGNSLHLDLIEVERWLATLPSPDRRLLDDWAHRQTTRPAYGGSKLGRINRLIEAYVNAEETSQAAPRLGPGVPLPRDAEGERGTTA